MTKQLSPTGTLPVAKDRGTQLVQTEVRAEAFIGLLPPPQVLIQYNEAFPGCAERIVSMAERQASHRRELEKRHLDANIWNERIGMFLGFTLALAAIGVGAWLIRSGKDVMGLTAIIAALASLVGVFIYGKKKTTEERARKLATIPSEPQPR